jgi:site-specific recombinase XerD
LYTQDARRFATWVQHEQPGLKVTEVTSTDAKAYRDHLLAKRYAPTTINRALVSLMLFFDTVGDTGLLGPPTKFTTLSAVSAQKDYLITYST